MQPATLPAIHPQIAWKGSRQLTLELRVERFGEEHIEPYVRLSRAEYGDHAAVSHENHLRWKFMENPQGPSVGIHLYRGGELVGRMVALARQFLHRDRVYTAAHIVDFLVHPDERGMPALLQLVRGLKQLSGFDFLLIMAPNPAGAAVWEKFVKMRGHFDLDAAVVPLRPAAVLQSTGKLRTGKLGAVLDCPWRLLAASATRVVGSLSRIRVEPDWPKPDELDRLLSADWGDRVIGNRSAEFLNWRYRRSPMFRYKVSFLRKKEELLGYFVTRRTVYNGLDCLFVVDAFGSPALTSASWRGVSLPETSRAATDGVEMVMLLGNTAWGALAAVSGWPFVKVPPRLLPRKTTVYAQWVGSPGFEIRRDNFYCALGDSDVV
ncbi:MAG: hypothetical protein WCC27_17675 [Acidobacteriaceae bacterium]